MEMESLQELYVDELKDLYSAEKQLVKALPKMVKNATNAELKEAFSNHLDETEGHVQRLEKIFQMLGEKAGGKKCKGMEGLIEEAKELLEEDASDEVLDAGLISKAQHVEHYEMAGYGTVRRTARLLRSGQAPSADTRRRGQSQRAVDADRGELGEPRGRRGLGRRGIYRSQRSPSVAKRRDRRDARARVQRTWRSWRNAHDVARLARPIALTRRRGSGGSR